MSTPPPGQFDSRHRQALIAPRAVALVGVSDDAAKLTARPWRFLRAHGFRGNVYAVNPRRDSVFGQRCWPTVCAIPEQIDHACIMVSTARVVDALRDCADAGVSVVSVLADGFAESGEDGAKRQAELVAIAGKSGMLLLGPNSMGVVDTRSGFSCTSNAAFASDSIAVGRVAALSQSGSLIGTLLSRGNARGRHFATFISVGNEALAGIGETAALLLDDDGIDAFVLVMETVRRPAALRRFAHRAAAAGKPVLVYLLGRSAPGQALAVSHTGALTGSVAATLAFLASLGFYLVSQLESLLEGPPVMRFQSRLQQRPKTCVVIATTGGGGAMVVDQLSIKGVSLGSFGAASRQTLSHFGLTANGALIDVTLAGTRYEVMQAVVTAVINDAAVGAVVVVVGSSAQFHPELAVRPVIDAVNASDCHAAPVFGCPLPHAEQAIEMLESAGIPSFRHIETCADCMAMLLSHRPPSPAFQATLPAAVQAAIDSATGNSLDEVAAAAVFEALGIAVPASTQLALPLPQELAIDLPFPLAAKLVSSDLPHKSDVGAVQLNLGSAGDVVAAVSQMLDSVSQRQPTARVDSVLLQSMQHGLCEVLLGLTHDPLVGAMITVAAGGVMAEIYQDSSVRPAPVSPAQARQMMGEVKALAIIQGYRGLPGGDIDALATAISRLSLLALCESVGEAEINPLLVKRSGGGVLALDALIRLRPSR